MHGSRTTRGIVGLVLTTMLTAPALARSAPREHVIHPLGPGSERMLYPRPGLPPAPVPPLPREPEPLTDGGVHSSTTAHATLDGNILTVACDQTYTNTTGRAQEIQVLLPIPAGAVVTDGLLLADGREFRADVLPAAEARQIYEAIVRQRRDPALLELAGHGLIRLSAFPIPAGGTRTVSYRFHEAMTSHDGRLRVRLNLATLCGLDRRGAVDFTLRISGTVPLAQVSSPSQDIEVQRLDARSARVRYRDERPDPRGTLEVNVMRDARDVGMDLRTARGDGEDGYFLLSLSPGWQLLTSRARAPQTAVFVLDTSGSMQGEKFAQAQAALRRFLDDLHADDRFNLIAFSSGVVTFAPNGPVPATARARRDARDWVESLTAGGGTNIAEALDTAVTPEWNASLVLFLTDGRATVGEISREAILQHATRAPRSLRFYAFGVGYDVDTDQLDDLASQGHGSVTYVHPREDIGIAVNTLRHRVERPCVRDVHVTIAGAHVHDVYPAGALDLFADEPLLIAGRMASRSGRAVIRMRGIAPNGQPLVATWPADFNDTEARSASVPVLWASRKAASMLADLRHEGRSPSLLDSLRALASRYGILTQEVALLAREPDLVAMQQSGNGVRFINIPKPISVNGAGSINKHVDLKSSTTKSSIDTKSLTSLPVDTFKEGIAIHPGSVAQAGQLHVRGGRAGEISYRVDDIRGHDPLVGGSAPSVALPAPTPQQSVQLAQSRWDLAARRTATDKRDADHVFVEGHEFHRDGDVWRDVAIDGARTGSLHVVRVRSYSHGYFALARQDARMAKWFALGEKVRLRIGDYVIEVAPDAPEEITTADLAAVAAALAANSGR